MALYGKEAIAAGVLIVMLTGCNTTQRQPSNVEVGYNQLCLGVDGVHYPGDPFAPVVNNSGCLRYGVQPMFPQ